MVAAAASCSLLVLLVPFAGKDSHQVRLLVPQRKRYFAKLG